MEYYPITNNDVSASLASILAYDLEYIKTHPNANLAWGNSTGNLSPKFYQFDELYSLALIGELISAGYELSKVVLSTINTGSTKIIQNSDYINVDKIYNASIIIPLDSESTANYVWYDPNYITQDNIKSLPALRKEHGNKIVEGSCPIGKGIPVLVKHQCHWAAVSNKRDKSFDFLQVVLSNNPTYDELKNYFGAYSGNKPVIGPRS
jgi:hypothetical protein